MLFNTIPILSSNVSIYLDIATGELTTLNEDYPTIVYQLSGFLVYDKDGNEFKVPVSTVADVVPSKGGNSLAYLAYEVYTLMPVLGSIKVNVTRQSAWFYYAKAMLKEKYFRVIGPVVIVISQLDEDTYEFFFSYDVYRLQLTRSKYYAHDLGAHYRDVLKQTLSVKDAKTYMKYNVADSIFESTNIEITKE